MEGVMMAAMANIYVQNMITQVKQKLKDEGFDRWDVKRYEVNYAAPDPNIFNMRMLIQDFYFGGIEKLVAKNVSFDPQSSSVNFDVCVPQLILKSGDSSIRMSVLENNLDSELRGWVGVKNFSVSCKVQLALSASGELKIENCDVATNVESVTADVHLNILGKDMSETINNYLRVNLPELIRSIGSHAKELLAQFAGAEAGIASLIK